MSVARSRSVFIAFAGASVGAACAFFALMGPRLAPATAPLDATGHAIGRDFVNVWNASRLAFEGKVAMLFDIDAYWKSLQAVFGPAFPVHNWSYPPHALLLFAPFGQLSYLPALACWTALTLAAFLAAASAGLPREGRTGWLALLALSPASIVDLCFGQNGHLTASLMLGGVLLLDRRPWMAGVLFGLLTIKPHLGILIPFACLAIGAWRPVVSAALTFAALAALSVALFGFEPWRLYLEVTTAVQASILTQGGGLFVAMMPTVYQAAKALAGAPFAGPSQAIVAIAVGPLAILGFRRASDAAGRALVLASGTLLCLPYAFNYDMVMLAGAIACWVAARDADRATLAVLAFAWAIPALVIPLALAGLPLGPLAIGLVFAVALADAFSSAEPMREAQSPPAELAGAKTS